MPLALFGLFGHPSVELVGNDYKALMSGFSNLFHFVEGLELKGELSSLHSDDFCSNPNHHAKRRGGGVLEIHRNSDGLFARVEMLVDKLRRDSLHQAAQAWSGEDVREILIKTAGGIFLGGNHCQFPAHAWLKR